MPGVLASGLADYIAVCDFDTKRVQDGKVFAEKYAREHARTAPEITMYGDYRELLARNDIDAVVISTPDHWHAELALAAIAAGKDVYLQKPMTMTINEGHRAAAQPSSPATGFCRLAASSARGSNFAKPANLCAAAAWAR